MFAFTHHWCFSENNASPQLKQIKFSKISSRNSRQGHIPQSAGKHYFHVALLSRKKVLQSLNVYCKSRMKLWVSWWILLIFFSWFQGKEHSVLGKGLQPSPADDGWLLASFWLWLYFLKTVGSKTAKTVPSKESSTVWKSEREERYPCTRNRRNHTSLQRFKNC